MRENWIKASLYKDLHFVKTGVEVFEEAKNYYSTGGIQKNEYTPEGKFTYAERPSRANRIVKKFDVLQARMQDTNKAILINDELDEQLFSTGFFQIRTYDEYASKFVYYYFNSLTFLNEKNSMCTGSTQSAINDNSLKTMYVPLAPLLEQKAIVAKIEQLFSELDNAVANLKTAQAKLKIYRQAVLTQPFNNKKSKILKIPDVVEKVQIGPFGSQLHKSDYIDNGIPLINPMHIQQGKIIPDSSYSISKDKRDELPNYILKTNDVIMGRRGEMGRCGLVGEKEDGWFCGTGSLYFRPKTEIINSTYLFYYLSSATVKEILTGKATGTTMANLNKKILHNLSIPIPDINTQNQIVQEIESRLSVCDKIEETIETSLSKSEALRQSILKKAFEGKLLSEQELENIKNHPEYESARELLERIKSTKPNDRG